MDAFNEIVRLIDANFIKGMFMSVLLIIFCRKILKRKFDTQNAISITRWVMVCYSLLVLVQLLLPAFLPSSSNIYLSSIQERATGRYSFAFWLMLLGAISPLILFLKKLRNKIYLILVLTLFMNIGWLMELLVIHVSIIQRDYYNKPMEFKAYLPSGAELMVIVQGVILGILLIVIGNLPFFRKNKIMELT